MGRYRVTFEAWVDHWGTWRGDLRKRVDAEQDVTVDLRIGATHVRGAAERIGDGAGAEQLTEYAELLETGSDEAIAAALSDGLDALMRSTPDRSQSTELGRELAIEVERERALSGAWYERFPRSTSPDPDRAGTLADLEAELPRIARMGFDVLYLPPIHPIGQAHRKGPNNSTVAGPDDPGSPWAIGSSEGGHTAIHPELGTLDDFDRLLAACTEHGLELALDLAYQCAPDHPWVTEHPSWFRARPDGTIQYAENPPKKYQDIYPIDFETDDWEELWHGLKSVVDFWVARGVRIFRVDNPHTKAFPFWEWMIDAVRREQPDVVFLSEAFTRPKVMYRLAKLGFSQSYTYFAWRQGRDELREYLEELTSPPASDVFRPNFWPNTPDILTDQLQHASRGTYVARLVLAATLTASYGIYGPAFELMESDAAGPGSEEYLDSEKYQVRHRKLDAYRSLDEVIRLVNAARHEHPALRRNDTLRFHDCDNDQILAYSKTSLDGSDVVLVVVNLDGEWRQGGFVHLDLEALGLGGDEPFSVHDHLGGATYQWQGSSNYVELDPTVLPAHVLHVRGRAHRDEHDVDGYT
ncbi:MAG: alpha amylase catalytic region [Thermoleophilia bacterium]|nr:alpha amylase catalytic region [Thermoleophilia bacterium]